MSQVEQLKKTKKNHNTELFVCDSTVKGHFLTLGALGHPDPCAECLDSVPYQKLLSKH